MLYLEVLVILTTLGSWVRMFRKGEGGLLSRQGLASLKYYTTLSNIFAGLVSLLFLLRGLVRGGGSMVPRWMALLKLSSAVSVALTFLVVMVFLLPRMGFAPLFKGELFCLHALGPFLTVASYLANPDLPDPGRGASLIVLVPTLLYGIFYAGNLLVNGVGEGEETNDWYGFLIGGLKTLPLVFAVILAAAWILALVLLRLKG